MILKKAGDEMHRVPSFTEQLGNGDWCKCGECEKMEISRDCVCNRELTLIPDDVFEGMYRYLLCFYYQNY